MPLLFRHFLCAFTSWRLHPMNITVEVIESMNSLDELKKLAVHIFTKSELKSKKILALKSKLLKMEAENTRLREDQENRSKEMEETKEAAILHWKAMLQRSIKAEKRTEKQINALQDENKQLMERLTEMCREPTPQPPVLVNEVETAPVTSDTKVEKLLQMLDTSHKRCAELEEFYRQIISKSIPDIDISDPVIFEIPRTSREKKPKTDSTVASLRKTMLQYFLKDEVNRNALMPVMLQLVGCTDEQIAAVKAKLESREQFINRFL